MQRELNYVVDIGQRIIEQPLNEPLFTHEQNAHAINVTLKRYGEDVQLSGAAECEAYILHEETQVSDRVEGSIEGNVVTVVIPPDTYLTPGFVRITLLVTEGEETLVVLRLTGTIKITRSSNIYDPSGQAIPDTDELIRRLQDIEEYVDDVEAFVDDVTAVLAPSFDPEDANGYSVGEFVIYNAKMYRCTAPHTGAWDPSHFEETTVADMLETFGDEISDLNSALDGKQDTLTFDNTPTSGSPNPVKSGGIYNALAGKQASLTFDTEPMPYSQNPVTSAGINAALQEAFVEANGRIDKVRDSVAPLFVVATANNAGSYVIYADGKLYFLPDGHTANETWANTTHIETTAGGELSDLKSHFHDMDDDLGDITYLTTDNRQNVVESVNELASVVYDQDIAYTENLFIYASESKDIHLIPDETFYTESQNVYGFYIDVSQYQGQYLVIKRKNTGYVLRGTFSVDVPAKNKQYPSSFRWSIDYTSGGTSYGISKKDGVVYIPETAVYLYVYYYNSNRDTITKEEAIEGMEIVLKEPSDSNLYNQRSEEKHFALNQATFQNGDSLYGFYIPLNNERYFVVGREYVCARFRVCFSSAEPAIGVAHNTTVEKDALSEFVVVAPEDANYMYVAFYGTAESTYTKEQCLEGMRIVPLNTVENVIVNANKVNGKLDKNQGNENSGKILRVNSDGDIVPVETDKELKLADNAADAESVGNLIFSGHDEIVTNLYETRSETMVLAVGPQSLNSASALYGFYVPVDPSISRKVTVQRNTPGSRFRIVATKTTPALGVAYALGKRVIADISCKVVYNLDSDDRYLYVAYYSSEQDTLTEAQLLEGMTIYYGEEPITKRISRIDKLDYKISHTFINGGIDNSGNIVPDSTSIVSERIMVNGTYGLLCPDTYVMHVHLYNVDGSYAGAYLFTTTESYPYWVGSIRICIEDSEHTDITPETVDFASIKIPESPHNPVSYTNAMTRVLDAENCQSDDVYAYIDDAARTHDNYVQKAFLTNDEAGLPVYYYTLGSGAKKICIVTGQHGPGTRGDPRDSVITVAKMVHDLITINFSKDSFLKELRDECTILVFPVLNPFGFDFRNRTNSQDIDLNRGWENPTTAAVSAAKSVIETFDPFMILDVHCNGGSPASSPNLGIEYKFGQIHSPLFAASAANYLSSYYNSAVDDREQYGQTLGTLSYYTIITTERLGGLLELRWWHQKEHDLHNSIVESLNYAMFVNAIKYFKSVHDNKAFEFELTPNQNHY